VAAKLRRVLTLGTNRVLIGATDTGGNFCSAAIDIERQCDDCDGDGYMGVQAGGPDCNDARAAVSPAAGFHEVDRGDGSFDWNCSGSEEKSLTWLYDPTDLPPSIIE
jgi:hypothetical protein